MKARWASAASRGIHPPAETGKALDNIARTTLENVKEFEETGSSANLVSSEKVQG